MGGGSNGAAKCALQHYGAEASQLWQSRANAPPTMQQRLANLSPAQDLLFCLRWELHKHYYFRTRDCCLRPNLCCSIVILSICSHWPPVAIVASLSTKCSSVGCLVASALSPHLFIKPQAALLVCWGDRYRPAAGFGFILMSLPSWLFHSKLWILQIGNKITRLVLIL